MRRLSGLQMERALSGNSQEASPAFRHFQQPPGGPPGAHPPSPFLSGGPLHGAPPPEGGAASDNAQRICELLVSGLLAAYVWHLQHSFREAWQQVGRRIVHSCYLPT